MYILLISTTNVLSLRKFVIISHKYFGTLERINLYMKPLRLSNKIKAVGCLLHLFLGRTINELSSSNEKKVKLSVWTGNDMRENRSQSILHNQHMKENCKNCCRFYSCLVNQHWYDLVNFVYYFCCNWNRLYFSWLLWL